MLKYSANRRLPSMQIDTSHTAQCDGYVTNVTSAQQQLMSQGNGKAFSREDRLSTVLVRFGVESATWCSCCSSNRTTVASPVTPVASKPKSVQPQPLIQSTALEEIEDAITSVFQSPAFRVTASVLAVIAFELQSPGSLRVLLLPIILNQVLNTLNRLSV